MFKDRDVIENFSSDNKKWSYKEGKNGPSKWGKKYSNCVGKNQSPINIESNSVKKCDILCKLDIRYQASKCIANISDESVNLHFNSENYVYYKDVEYKVYKSTIHFPSMHQVDKKIYSGEICLYHKALNGDILIISIFLEKRVCNYILNVLKLYYRIYLS